jgi:hypothetical protein
MDHEKLGAKSSKTEGFGELKRTPYMKYVALHSCFPIGLR